VHDDTLAGRPALGLICVEQRRIGAIGASISPFGPAPAMTTSFI
jgi:hypothetical protein